MGTQNLVFSFTLGLSHYNGTLLQMGSGFFYWPLAKRAAVAKMYFIFNFLFQTLSLTLNLSLTLTRVLTLTLWLFGPVNCTPAV